MTKRVKAIRFFSLLMLVPCGLIAQSGQFVTSARTVDSGKVRVNADMAPETRDISTLPLFGETPKTPEQIEWEIRFLTECDQNFNSREEASQFFASRGWEYLAEEQLDTASHRFNLAWLLSDKNADTYWGWGVIGYQRGKFPEAIRLLKKGLDVADTNAVLMTDLATVELKYYRENQDAALLNDAMALLDKALQYDATNVNTYMRLSWAYYAKGEYGKAWEHLHKARSLELSAVDLVYLRDLLAKQPDPRGIFK